MKRDPEPALQLTDTEWPEQHLQSMDTVYVCKNIHGVHDVDDPYKIVYILYEF